MKPKKSKKKKLLKKKKITPKSKKKSIEELLDEMDKMKCPPGAMTL